MKKQKKNNIQKHVLILGGALLIVVLDHLAKWLVMTKMHVSQSIVLINNVFHITYVQNMGAGFGILQGQRFLLIFISVFAIALMFYYYKKIPEVLYVQWSVMLLLGGTIGNGIERIFRGYVVDFIQINIWPMFNIADTCIVLGGIGLIYYFWQEDKKETKKKIKN